MSSDAPIGPQDITGLVLAGGRGSRMGGIDKGLQLFDGVPLALHALRRLQGQVGSCLVNANRHIAQYAAFEVDVVPDAMPDHPGPLAGFLAGLAQCRTTWLLTVPCDAPCFPLDLARRLSDALVAEGADIAMPLATSVGMSGSVSTMQPQPVFCLLHTRVRASLEAFVHGGGRKVREWTSTHRTALVPFDRSGDAADAFVNANTLAELQTLQSLPDAPGGGLTISRP